MEDSAKEIHDLEMELDEAIDLETASADRVELMPDEEVNAFALHIEVKCCSKTFYRRKKQWRLLPQLAELKKKPMWALKSIIEIF